jgi:hypothetical protein
MKQLVFVKKSTPISTLAISALLVFWMFISLWHLHFFYNEACSIICFTIGVINSTVIFLGIVILLIAAFSGAFDEYKIYIPVPSFQVSKEDELLMQIGKAAVEKDIELEKELFEQLDKLRNEKV